MFTFKWYWPMEILGLVEDLSEVYNDGTTYSVSAKCGEVYGWMLCGFMVFSFVLGFAMRLLSKKEKMNSVKYISIVYFLYAIFLAVGIGPYIELYPQGSGFIDLSAIENLFDGIYMALCGVLLILGGKIARWIKQKIVKKDKT